MAPLLILIVKERYGNYERNTIRERIKRAEKSK